MKTHLQISPPSRSQKSPSVMKTWSVRALLLTLGLFTLAPAPVQALPIDRIEGRQNARASRQDGRQTSRARWRGTYLLPPGAAVVAVGGYRCYRVGPRYYYPYMYGGRTVYIDINVVGGHPVPPPPAGSIEINFY